MLRSIVPANQRQPVTPSPVTSPVRPALNALLSNSEDEFYGSLQRIWNHVVQLEDMGIIHDDYDKFAYAYRFAEVELQRLYLEKDNVTRLAGVPY